MIHIKNNEFGQIGNKKNPAMRINRKKCIRLILGNPVLKLYMPDNN